MKLDRKQIVVIRSSVLPSIFDECVADIRLDKRLVWRSLCANPEFLREGTAIRDFDDPPFTILGTQTAAAEQTLRSLYSEHAAPVYVLEPREALDGEIREQRLPRSEGCLLRTKLPLSVSRPELTRKR